MRRFSFLLFLLGLFVIVEAEAQEPMIGLHAGIDFSTMKVTTGSTTGFQENLALGASFEVPLIRPVFIMVRPTYLQRDVERSDSLPQDLQFATIDYFQIPVALKVYLTTENVLPYIYAGSNYAIKLSADIAGGSGVNAEVPDFSDGDLQIDIGAGVVLPLVSSIRATADLRYGFGITDVRTDAEEWHSRSLTLTGGIGIAI